MAFDAFLKIDGIPGESTDKIHKDEIDLLSFNWGETNASSQGVGGGGGGGGAGRVVFQDFHFTAHVNKSSPLLFFACASGQHIKTATLTCRKAGSPNPTGAAAATAPRARQGEFLIFQMTDVVVSGWADAGVTSDDQPVDSFSLNFAQLEVEYTPATAIGNNGPSITRGWNVRTHKKV